jgi:hypothetical protein
MNALEQEPVRLIGVVQAVVAAAAVVVAFGAPWWGALILAAGLYVFEEVKRQRVIPVWREQDPGLSYPEADV